MRLSVTVRVWWSHHGCRNPVRHVCTGVAPPDVLQHLPESLLEHGDVSPLDHQPPGVAHQRASRFDEVDLRAS